MRTFEDKPAKREAVPLLIGIVGSSGSGKTFSALRLASGIGGPIFFLDSEAKRALWYADKFDFQHVEFKAPFSPDDYLAAIQYCFEKGAKTIIIDSFSMEWEGQDGVLEMQEKELDRIAGNDYAKRDRCKMMAWIKPKMQHRKLLNAILQMPVNFIFCFRAKEKIDLSQQKPRPLGWMPIASDDVIYEMSLNVLLMPNSRGIPCWHPAEMGEKAIIKLPSQFEAIFAKNEPLSEEIGGKLANWAKGVTPGAQAMREAINPLSVKQVDESKLYRNQPSASAHLQTSTPSTPCPNDLPDELQSITGKAKSITVTKLDGVKTGYKIVLESGATLSTPEDSVIEYLKQYKGFDLEFKHFSSQIESVKVCE